MMYLLFNEYGAIKDKQINELIVQGSNNVNKIGVAIDGVDSTSFALVGVCKLPNGEVITTAPVDEQAEIIDGVYGVVFSLSKDITALEGTLRINIQAINTTTNKIITSYTVYLCVNEGVDPGEIVMMTADQYQDLLSKIELDVQQDETILTFSTRPEAEYYSLGQIIYVKTENKLYECVSNNDTLEWHETFDFNDHYTKAEVDTMLNAKQDKLTRESLPTAQLQYSVGFDAQGNLSKGAGGGGGGAIYNAGTGINITDFTISIDDTVVATKTFVSETYETIAHASTIYATKTELETVKKNAFIKVNTTTYPTLASFLLSTGEEGYIYLYPIDTTDLTKGYYQYIWEDNAWLGIGSTRIDLSNYAELSGNNTFTGQNTFNVKLTASGGVDTWQIIRQNVQRLYFGDFTPDVGARTIYPLTGGDTLGKNSGYWQEGFINKITDANGSYSSDNVLNVINASDIINNTLTQAQFDLMTNGKQTLIKGVFLTVGNPILYPIQSFGTFGVIIGRKTDGKNIISTYTINSDLVVSISTAKMLTIQGIYSLNGKLIPDYPSSPTQSQLLGYKPDNTLAYLSKLFENADGFGLVPPSTTGWTADKTIATTDDLAGQYVVNLGDTLYYDRINTILLGGNFTYTTLQAAPSGLYMPEYKGYITNSDTTNAITITLPTAVTIIKADSTLSVVQPVISGGSVTTAGSVTIPASGKVEFSIMNNLALFVLWSD